MTSHPVMPLSSLIPWTSNLHSCSLPKQHSVRFAVKLFCGQKYVNRTVPSSLAADRKLEKQLNSLRLAQYPVFCNKATTVLFWVITLRVLAITYRRFGTTYRSHLQGSRIQEPIATTRCVMTQKSAVLIYCCFGLWFLHCLSVCLSVSQNREAFYSKINMSKQTEMCDIFYFC